MLARSSAVASFTFKDEACQSLSVTRKLSADPHCAAHGPTSSSAALRACCASCSTEAVRELHTKLADADVRDCADLPRIIFGLAVVAPGSAVILMLLAPPGNWPAVRLWSTATLSTSHRRTTRQLRECLTFFMLREVYRTGDYRHS